MYDGLQGSMTKDYVMNAWISYLRSAERKFLFNFDKNDGCQLTSMHCLWSIRTHLLQKSGAHTWETSKTSIRADLGSVICVPPAKADSVGTKMLILMTILTMTRSGTKTSHSSGGMQRTVLADADSEAHLRS